MSRPRWYCITQRAPHHSGYSGYERLVTALPDVRRIVRPDLSSRLFWLPNQAFSLLVRPFAGMPRYFLASSLNELYLAAHSRLRPSGLYHFLHAESQFWASAWLRGGRDTRLLATFHQPDWRLTRLLRNPERTLPTLDAAVVVGSNQAAYLAQFVGAGNVYVVPHGVDIDFFQPAPRPPNERPICLFVGSSLRDFATLRAVVERLHQQRPGAVEVVVITRPSELRYLEGCPGVRLLAGLSDSELRAWYQRADLLLLPLLDCTANNSVLEALACGLPLVVSDVGGIRDYADETCALFVPPADAEAHAAAVWALLDDTARRTALAQAARQRALLFDWPVIAARMRAIYREVQRQPPRSAR